MEPRFGYDFSQVRVHNDALAAESARSLDAQAYTIGRDVVFAPNRYSPGSTRGRALLAHELEHVIQQGSDHAPGVPIDQGPDDIAEREADRHAANAMTPPPRIHVSETEQRADGRERSRSVVLPSRSVSPLNPHEVSRPGTQARVASIQRRTVRESYATAAQIDKDIGPLWDVSLTITGAPNTATDDLQEFTSACEDGIRSAIYALGRSPSAPSGKVKVTIEYKAKRLYSDVSDDTYRLALKSTGVKLETKAKRPDPSLKAQPPSPSTQPTTPPATVPSSSRTQEQTARLTVLRNLRSELAAAFSVVDVVEPTTSAYDACVKVRGNVMEDINTALDDAESRSRGPRATEEAPAIQTDLEQAQLWLFLVQHYAQLAALIRSAEHDRLIPDVIVNVAHEAQAYEKGFTQVQIGTPEALLLVRNNALAQVENTQKLLSALKTAIAKGQSAVKTAEKVEGVLDIPLNYAAGRVIPFWALAATTATEAAGLYAAHPAEVDSIADNAWGFFAELKWLNSNAPVTSSLVLDPVYLAIGKEALRSVSLANVAFIMGRTVRGLAGAAGKVSVALFVGVLAGCTALVLAVDSSLLVVHGLGKLTEKTKEAALKDLGGKADPGHIIAEVNKNFDPPLSASDVAALLLELQDPARRDHLKRLADVGKVMGPSIAAIVADLQGTGALTAVAAKTGLTAVPLLPPAP